MPETREGRTPLVYAVGFRPSHHEVAQFRAAVEFPYKPEIQWLNTEGVFQSLVHTIVKQPPDLFLIKLMMSFEDPLVSNGEVIPVYHMSERTLYEGFYTGGLRCLDALLVNSKTANVPTILYDHLGAEDLQAVVEGSLPDHVRFDPSMPLRKPQYTKQSVERLGRFIKSGLFAASTERSSPVGTRNPLAPFPRRRYSQ